MVNHEEVDSLLGINSAMNVHGVEVEWNVATFNVQLDVSPKAIRSDIMYSSKVSLYNNLVQKLSNCSV